MRNRWKIIVLVLILLIPAALYVFLRVFGQNEFSVPIYNSDGEIESIVSKADNFSGDHKVSLDALFGENISGKEQIKNKVVILDMLVAGEKRENEVNQINRIADIFDIDESVHILRIIPVDQEGLYDDSSFYHVKNRKNISDLRVEPEVLKNFTNSQLGLDPGHMESFSVHRIVLIDEENRIRGYYNPGDFNDIDRLILEVKILLKNLIYAS